MSVFIPGMEMPKACGECSFQASRWTGDFCSAGQFMIGMDCDPRDKHQKCPLVEIKTPHGRLIDADTLCRIDGKDEEGFSCQIVYDWDIEEAPTIIEAEGGSENG